MAQALHAEEITSTWRVIAKVQQEQALSAMLTRCMSMSYININVLKFSLKSAPAACRYKLLSERSQNGIAVIHRFASDADVEFMECALDGMMPDQILSLLKMEENSPDIHLTTAVHIVIKRENIDVLRCMLYPLSQDQRYSLLSMIFGSTLHEDESLIIYKTLNNRELLEYVLSCVTLEQRFSLLTMTYGGQTALHLAIRYHHIAAVKSLLNGLTAEQKFSLLKIEDTRRNDTAIHMAVRKDSPEVIIKCVLDGLTADQKYELLKIKVKTRGTALHCVYQTEKIHCMLDSLTEDQIYDLLKIKNPWGQTVVHSRVDVDCKLIASAMDHVTADFKCHILKIANEEGVTVLHKVAFRNQMETLEPILHCLTAKQRDELFHIETNDGISLSSLSIKYKYNHTATDSERQRWSSDEEMLNTRSSPGTLFDQLVRAIEGSEFAQDEISGILEGSPPHIILDDLRQVDPASQRNLLMLAIASGNNVMSELIVDWLKRSVKDFHLWTANKLVDFLYNTDADGNNVLQLAVQQFQPGLGRSDWAITTILSMVKMHNPEKVAGVIRNRNHSGCNSLHMAVAKKLGTGIIRDLLAMVSADILAVKNSRGCNVLNEAIENSSEMELILLLLDKVKQAESITDTINVRTLRAAVKAGESYFLLLLQTIPNDQVGKAMMAEALNGKTILYLMLAKDFIKSAQYTFGISGFKAQLSSSGEEFPESYKISPNMRDLISRALNLPSFQVPLNSRIGQTCAIIFINDVPDAVSSAASLDTSLTRIGFHIQHLTHSDWNSQTLCDKLVHKIKDVKEKCTFLLVCGLSHGNHLCIEDPDGKDVKIGDISDAIKENLPDNTPIVLIIDACQTKNKDAENAAVSPLAERTHPYIVITCAPDEESWGDVFIKAFNEQINSGERDIFTILQKTRDAVIKSGKKVTGTNVENTRRKQNPQLPKNLKKGEIRLPVSEGFQQTTTDVELNAADDEEDEGI